MAKRVAQLTIVLCLGCPIARFAGAEQSSVTPLYGKEGISPEAVRQGILGSCYFHSVAAALAQANPESIRKMIQANADGTYTVEFADGKKETAYPEDIEYSRNSGYDLSDGLWVAVLFRAFAQRVLRSELVAALDQSDMPPLLKPYAENFIASNDLLLLAYDRAIRAVVDQDGSIDRSRLEAETKSRLAMVDIPDEIKGSLLGQLDSEGVFASIESMIKENGEIFGAYRAVGQGGVPLAVMQTLDGSGNSSDVGAVQQDSEAIGQAVQDRRPIVACTRKGEASALSLPAGSDDWYVPAHCYTVLGYDQSSQRIGMRNPWGHKPAPDGVFGIPVGTFAQAFQEIVIGGQ